MMVKFFDEICDHFDGLSNWTKALIGTAVVIVPGYFIFYGKKRTTSLLKPDYQRDVVYLYQFSRALCIPSLSPFCLKLETWLRMADIYYENVDCSPATRSSKGLMPFIELNGKQYADSGFIIKHLTKVFQKDGILDPNMSNEQKACARAFEQMVENSTAFSYIYTRWIENADELLSEKVMGTTSLLMKLPFIRWSIQKNVRNRCNGHGIGRHNRDEIISIGFDDLRALSIYMGDKEFFGGTAANHVDASLFGLLAQLVYIPIETPHGNFLKSECRNLVQYCERMKERFWPDWHEACTTRSLHTTGKKSYAQVVRD